MWSDRRGGQIESHLSEFVASVLVAAERQRLDRIEAEERRLEALRQERRRQAIELHNDADDVLEKDLASRLKDWRQAREIEGFASAVRERATKAGEPVDPDSLVGRWLKWAGIVIAYFDRKAIDKMEQLREGYSGYKLRSRFGWQHDLTTADALDVFFIPIEDLVKELDLKAQAQEGQS